MRNWLFKRLFEVRFLHEYYLANGQQPGDLFFSRTVAQQRLLLDKLLRARQYDILRDLDIEPTPETAARLRGRDMKFKKTATGFIVGASVEMEEVNGQNLFRPTIDPGLGLRLSFFVRLKNPEFRAFTALRLLPPNDFTPLYWFSNARKTAGNTPFPSLSEAVPDFLSGQTYSPGELAVVSGTVREAVARTQTATAAHWAPAADNGYVSENDRLLLAKQFVWLWTGDPGPIEFTLRNEDGEAVKTITTSVTDRSRRVRLDFLHQPPPAGKEFGAPVPDGYYQLEALSGGDTTVRTVFLHGELTSEAMPPAGLLGMVEIVHENPPAALPYLDPEGRRRQIALPGGEQSHPVFEVRWLSRSAWWRYRSERDLDLQATNDATLFLEKAGKDLVTRQSRRFTAQAQAFRLPAGSPIVWLPSPSPAALRPDTDGRFYADVLVPAIPNFIDAT